MMMMMMMMPTAVCPFNRVRTDPGKLWKVMAFKLQIFQAWNFMESGLGPEKS